MISRHHTRLLVAITAALVFALAGARIAGAQEGDDPLTRYDSPQTKALAREYEANEKRATEIEARIEELEADYDFGAERDRLRDELAEMPDSTEADNRIGDARLADIESAPLPTAADEKAAELRRKAESLDALQAWADSEADIDINSRLYGVLGRGEAASLAGTYRREAGALEVASNSEEVAAEKKEAAEEAVPEPEKETETPGGGAGGERPAEGEPEPQPEPAPDEGGAGEDSGGGTLTGIGSAASGFSLTSLLAAALIALGVGYYIVGLLREGLGDCLKRVGAPQQARAPKPKSKPGGKTGSQPKSKPGPSEPETPRAGERTSKKPERELREKPSAEPRQDRSAKKTEERDGSALADRLRRMRGDDADPEPPTAEELNDMFNRPDGEDDGGEGR